MELYAVDQVSISSVRADSLKPGEKFVVSKALGEELLSKLPGIISASKPHAKVAPVSVKTVLDGFADKLATAQADADAKLLAIEQTVKDAQAAADAKIADIDASVETARTNADAEIKKLEADLALRKSAAAEPDGSLGSGQQEMASQNGEKSDAPPANKADTPPANKAEQAPQNKAEAPPKNK